MAATILIWYSHGKSLLNFGHVSLALTHNHAFQTQRLATISWFSENVGDAKQVGLFSSGLSNPVNWWSVNTFSSRTDAPASSGMSGGWQGGDSGKHGLPGQVLHEFTGYGQHGAEKIALLEKKQLDLITAGTMKRMSVLQVQQSKEFKDLQNEINKLQRYYPKMREVANKNHNQWMNKYIAQYQDAMGYNDAQRWLETRVAPASETITIPTLSDDNVHAGLNDLLMMSWWEDYLQTKKKYNWRKRNCATTVATALLVGGASYAVQPPRTGLFWAPKNLQEWGKKLAKRYRDYEQKFVQARATLTNASNDAKLNLSGNYSQIWSVQKWKQESDAGYWARRYGTLTKIDKGLEMFHKNYSGGHAKLATRNLELQNLVVITVLLAKILTERPNTKRKKAVVELGMQVLNWIGNLKQQQQSHNLAQDYKHYLSELKDTWSGGWQKQLEEYKDLDEIIEQEFPDAKNRIGNAGPVDNPLTPEDLIIALKNISEELDGYEPDIRGIMTDNRRRNSSLDSFSSRNNGGLDLNRNFREPTPIYDGIHTDDEEDF